MPKPLQSVHRDSRLYTTPRKGRETNKVRDQTTCHCYPTLAFSPPGGWRFSDAIRLAQKGWNAHPQCLVCRSVLNMEPLLQHAGNISFRVAFGHSEMLLPTVTPILRAVASSDGWWIHHSDRTSAGGCHNYKNGSSSQLRPRIITIQLRKSRFEL